MNLKRLTTCGIAAAMFVSMMAVPARRGLRTFSQPDGTKVSLQLIGDEHFHSYVTADGLAAERGKDGFFYLRSANGISDIRVSAQEKNAADLSAYSFSKMVGERAEKIKARKSSSVRKNSAARAQASQVPSSGSPRIPILLVQYKDVKFKDADPKKTFTSFFTEGNTSAHQYFTDQSNGKYTPQFDVYGPYTLSGNRDVYGGNDYDGYDVGVGNMVGQACQGLDSQIDFSKYDNDGDGECDVVIVLYAGVGEASSDQEGAEDSVWPCQWELSSSEFGKSLTLDGKRVDKFAVFNELFGLDPLQIDGIGTFCHEFSHCLGLPDFYDTQYGPHFGMGHWSLMDYGSYNDDGYTPIGYSAYEKEFMNWITIEEAAENTRYTLPVFNSKNIDKDKAVKITNDKDRNEYYILENRAQQGWDEFMPAEGLMIYHVTYDDYAWQSNTVNDYDLQRMTPIPADNSLKLDKETFWGETYYQINEDDLLGDLWPYKGNNALTDTSRPAAKVNTGGLMGKPVTDITVNEDGTISFWAMKAPLPAVATPENLSHTIASATSAVISWDAVEGDVTYTLEVKPHKDITYTLVSETDFYNDNTWSTKGFTEADDNEMALKLGSSKNVGGVTSPTFTTDDQGVVTVVFNSKTYNNDKTTITVSLLNTSGSVLGSENVTLTSNFEDYTCMFNAPQQTDVKICIESTKNKNRFYLRAAFIFNGDASEREEARSRAASDVRIFDGLTTTTFTVTDLTPNTIYDYRVKAVPVDLTKMDESAWSPVSILDMSDVTGVELIENTAVTEYFTLQGVRLNSQPLTPGIYLVRIGSETRKVLVK